MLLLPILLLFSIFPDTICFFFDWIGRTQCVGVKGRLVCNGKPYSGADLRLYDYDAVDFDDLMAQTITNSSGHFNFYGCVNEITNIAPKLEIYHDCDDKSAICKALVTKWIPYKYVSLNFMPKKQYPVGKIELDDDYGIWQRDCIH